MRDLIPPNTTFTLMGIFKMVESDAYLEILAPESGGDLLVTIEGSENLYLRLFAACNGCRVGDSFFTMPPIGGMALSAGIRTRHVTITSIPPGQSVRIYAEAAGFRPDSFDAGTEIRVYEIGKHENKGSIYAGNNTIH